MITISNLSNKKDHPSYAYKDIKLDFQESKASFNRRNNDVVSGNDVVADTDINAIKNSIINILTQNRYTSTIMNVNLKKYLGEPTSTMVSMSIGNDIDKGLTLLEPRITVKNILVSPDIDKFTYRIVIIYIVKTLSSAKQVIEGTINSTGIFNQINN